MSGPFGPDADDLFMQLDQGWRDFTRKVVVVACVLSFAIGFALGWWWFG